MKSLIRFEDTYGLTDIFMKSHNLQYLDINKISERMIQVGEETFIDFGLSSNWHAISTDEAYDIMERGIERIIFVYDVDNETGDKKKILSDIALKKYIKDAEQIFDSLKYTVDMRHIQLIYAAETIMLFQVLSESNDIRMVDLVHAKNTNDFQLSLLAYMLNYKNKKEAKQVRNYLQLPILVSKFKGDLNTDDTNYHTKSWIAKGCLVHDNILMTPDEAVENRSLADINFRYWLKSSNRTLQIGNKIFYLNKTNN